MLHAGLPLRLDEVGGRGDEEVHDCVVLERRRVRHVDDDIGSGDSLVESFLRQGVAASLEGGGNRLVTVSVELDDELGADQPGSADDDDLHGLHLSGMAMTGTKPGSLTAGDARTDGSCRAACAVETRQDGVRWGFCSIDRVAGVPVTPRLDVPSVGCTYVASGRGPPSGSSSRVSAARRRLLSSVSYR